MNAQTMEELKAEKAEKASALAAIQGEVDAIQAKINALPGWRKGAFGTIGASLSEFSDWYSKGQPNSSAGNIGITINGFANLIQDKFFWRNSGNLNLGWVKFDDKDDPTDSDKFEQATDVFTISSLYGRKLSDKFALSGLGEYRTTFLEGFNDPGYLDLGVGATWTPIQDLIVVFHPLNYNFVFAKEDNIFNSSLGCKVLADYTRQLPKGISWKSNLSAFYSYEDADLSNWTWVNGVGFKIWKGIGVGGELGIRGNKQEAVDYNVNTLGLTDVTFDNVDNKLQSYWLIGLTFGF
jgi:hypothetical protein